MTSTSKIVNIDELDDLVNKYNNAHLKTIRMKLVDVIPGMDIYFHKESNKKGPKSKVCDNVRISKYKNFLQNDMFQIGRKKLLRLKKLKNTVLWTYTISDLNTKEIVGTFQEKELQKNQKNFRVEKSSKKGDKLYVKLKGSYISLKSWVDKKYIQKMSEYFPEPKS